MLNRLNHLVGETTWPKNDKKNCTRNKHAVSCDAIQWMLQVEEEPHSVTKQFARFFVVFRCFSYFCVDVDTFFLAVVVVWLNLESFSRLHSKMNYIHTLWRYVFRRRRQPSRFEWPWRCELRMFAQIKSTQQWFFIICVMVSHLLLSLNLNLNFLLWFCFRSADIAICLSA